MMNPSRFIHGLAERVEWSVWCVVESETNQCTLGFHLAVPTYLCLGLSV